MALLIYYVVIQLVLDAIAVAIGLAIEQVSPALSMPIFLILYFGALWLAWVIAVYITDPRHKPAAMPGPAE